MKKSISVSLLLLLAIFWSCSDSPNPDQEFIKTATITVNGYADKKVEFQNNGIEYTGALVYYPVLNAERTEWIFPQEPNQKIDFIYEGDLMVKILETPFKQTELARFAEFEYRDSSIVIRSGPTKQTEAYNPIIQSEMFRMRNVEDGFYFYKNSIAQYENGNEIGYGWASPDFGTFDYKGKKWYFVKKTFDNKPNYFTNLGVSYLLGVGSIFNRNNCISVQINGGEVINTDKYQYHSGKLIFLGDKTSYIRFQY